MFMVVRQARSSLTRWLVLAELSVRFPRRESVEHQGVGHGAKPRDDYRAPDGKVCEPVSTLSRSARPRSC